MARRMMAVSGEAHDGKDMTTLPTTDDDAIIELWVNCPDEKTALAIADKIVGECLAAAANVYPPIQSRYRWKGELQSAREVPLLLKSRRPLFEALADRVAELHPYETPSILGAETSFASRSYRAWLLAETAG
jgi:periplasmic divalent cation tolerance protein